MAIARAQKNGMRIYDFLAGDAHYKARLGQQMGTLVWCRDKKIAPACRRTVCPQAMARRPFHPFVRLKTL